jgi:diacylglycerol kinase family enzyme
LRPPAILINARAGHVARNPAWVERLREKVPAANLRLTHNPAEVPAALEALRETEFDTLVIVGGDGSVTGTLTPLLELWPHDRLPRVLLAGGGTVNTIAKSLCLRGGPQHVLARLLRGAHHTEQTRSVLRVRVSGEKDRYGMIFVCGAPIRFLEFYYERSHQGVLGSLHSLLASVGSIAVGGQLARKLFQRFEIDVRIDGQVMELKHATILGASGVQDVGLGFKPFTMAGRDPDRFHWLATDIDGRGLGLRIPGLRLGLEGALSALDHALARSVEIRTRKRMVYSLDAELYPGKREFRIEAGPAIRFLSV